MKQIPNLFTLLNLIFGCIAIVYILQNGIVIFADSEGAQLVDVPERLWMASLFIGLAGVVDFLDGFVARIFKAHSEMGKQLDSLADLVSFGVAPGLILYQFLRLSFAKEENGLDVSFLWLVPVFILPAAAAWRLAKFNLDPGQEFSFRGMPTPAIGLLVASFPLIYFASHGSTSQEWLTDLLLNKWFIYAVVLILSALMVSSLPLMSLKFKDYSFRNNLPKYLLAVIAIASIIILQWLAVPVIIIAYVLVSLLFKNKAA
ncbi:MAG TPA: CDP-alcohol phosphatidyltransferase family protein [Chitinophagaceae bacterium]|nr:CDP-alcohol phosphatidyltransferase family protein [Chitinophagaceae bacterium]